MNSLSDQSPSGADLPRDVPAALRGFGPAGILAVLVILAGNLLFLPLSALLVLVWARVSRTPWRELGFVRPRNWPATVIGGIAFGVAFKFAMKAVVMPLLGADPVNHAYHYLAGNRAALPGAIYAMVAGAGFGEETVFRGYLFERLRRVFGAGAGAGAGIVVIGAALFGVAHFANQGVPGVEQATIVGLVFGAIYATRGQLVLLMIAHAAFDLTALWMIFANLETRVAHLLFR